MTQYGLFRPWNQLFFEASKGVARRVRTLIRQRKIETERGISIASDVECFGTGRILIGAHAKILSKVIIISEAGATVEIGSDAVIGEKSFLLAARGQRLYIGPKVEIAEHVTLYSLAGASIGTESKIGRFTEIMPREPNVSGAITLGERVHIQSNNILDVCSDINIEDDVCTGCFCSFYTHNHRHAQDKLIWAQGIDREPIHISSGSWIGQNCTLLPGTKIGKGAVVAAGAVVNRSVPSGLIYGGVPAKEIGRTGSAYLYEKVAIGHRNE